jgi:uncharacterized protein (TIGR02145 family)
MKKRSKTIAGGGFNSAMGRKTTQKTLKFKLLATVVCTAVALVTSYGKDNGAVTAIAKGEATITTPAGSCSAPLWGDIYVASVKPFSWWNCGYFDCLFNVSGTITDCNEFNVSGEVPDCDDYNVFGEVTDCNGAPISSVRVTGYLTDDEASTSVSVLTNSYGRYRLQFPAYSNVTITVKSSDYGNYSSEVSYAIKGKSAGSWVQKIIKLPCVENECIVKNECFWNGDTSVVINGVTWATRNVDAPGTFACNSGDAGMLYQWNRNIGWSSTDPMVSSNCDTTWDSSYPDGDEWESANDPSPAGWRVPTLAEIQTLFDTAKVSSELIDNGSDSIGWLFTDKSTDKSLLFPSEGGYRAQNGSLHLGVFYYWSSTLASRNQYVSNAYCLYIEYDGNVWFSDYIAYESTRGYSVRCVSE